MDMEVLQAAAQDQVLLTDPEAQFGILFRWGTWQKDAKRLVVKLWCEQLCKNTWVNKDGKSVCFECRGIYAYIMEFINNNWYYMRMMTVMNMDGFDREYASGITLMLTVLCEFCATTPDGCYVNNDPGIWQNNLKKLIKRMVYFTLSLLNRLIIIDIVSKLM